MDPRLDKFIEAQKRSYQSALSEIRAGRKESHWIWYIFPQMRGLGHSYHSELYGIEDRKMAENYLSDPVLGAHLIEISEALLSVEGKTIHAILGYPDDAKVCSCMTLFQAVSPDKDNVFTRVLQKYYGGNQDERTLRLLEEGSK